jgi:hypothetical protein
VRFAQEILCLGAKLFASSLGCLPVTVSFLVNSPRVLVRLINEIRLGALSVEAFESNLIISRLRLRFGGPKNFVGFTAEFFRLGVCEPKHFVGSRLGSVRRFLGLLLFFFQIGKLCGYFGFRFADKALGSDLALAAHAVSFSDGCFPNPGCFVSGVTEHNSCFGGGFFDLFRAVEAHFDEGSFSGCCLVECVVPLHDEGGDVFFHLFRVEP